MNWLEVYPIVATEIADTISDRSSDISHLYNALLGFAALSTDEGSEQQGYGPEATFRLMHLMNFFYNHTITTFLYPGERLVMVYKINTFTIDYFDNLTDFVNNLNWSDECIPYYWAQLSEEAGFDTGGWNVCS